MPRKFSRRSRRSRSTCRILRLKFHQGFPPGFLVGFIIGSSAGFAFIIGTSTGFAFIGVPFIIAGEFSSDGFGALPNAFCISSADGIPDVGETPGFTGFFVSAGGVDLATGAVFEGNAAAFAAGVDGGGSTAFGVDGAAEFTGTDTFELRLKFAFTALFDTEPPQPKAVRAPEIRKVSNFIFDIIVPRFRLA